MTDQNKQPYYIAWDTETDLICSSFYDLQEREADILHWAPKKDHTEILGGMLSDPSVHIITHNGGGFDLGVLAKHCPSLLPLIWDALNEGRIHCTMIREMLLNLATFGSIDNVPVEGVNKQMHYSLAELAMNYLGIDLSAAKEDEDAPRTNFALVKNLPLSEWPESFVKYAKDDAEIAARVFLSQEARRQRLIEERGIDAFVTEGFRVRVHFALSLMTARGNRLDPDEVLRVTKEFQDMYNDPELVQPLIEAGIVVPAQPATPNARGTKEHLPTCPGHKDHPDRASHMRRVSAAKKRGEGKDICACPVKMNKAQPEKTSVTTLHEHVWALAVQPGALIEAWASDSLLDKLKEAGLKDEVIKGGKRIDTAAVQQQILESADCNTKTLDTDYLPKGWTLCVDKEWMANFAALDPVLEKYAERQKIAKIVTSYLPKLYWAEGYDQCPPVLPGCQTKFEGKVPAKRVHSQFSPLKETGRCSSRAASKGRGKDEILLYPSWNGQQVDPRVRGCVIPDEGNVLFSIDYSAMELGTAAQVCLDLFGASILADKINAGVDTHAFLGAQIAYALDPVLEKYAERQKIAKIVTSYLPKLYWAEGYDQCPPVLPGCNDKFEGKVPAKRVHSQFSPLKETGRCSSRAASKGRGKDEILLYPSWNGQQVDPRVRGCVIPDEGNVLFSIDYSAMELGTAAQVCLDLFGASILADKINAGVDTHAFLGAQIAYAIDPYFRGACPSPDRDDVFECFSQTKGFDEKCDSELFASIHEDGTWGDFFKHYRKFAKPTGLGYPGGLGPKTFIAYAKGTYGVTVDLPTAELLRGVWRQTYPELQKFLDYVDNHCEDPFNDPIMGQDKNGNYYETPPKCYISPLGMYRARCTYCACANGKALQTPSAEGALGANADVMMECTVGTLSGKVWPAIFIHDELFGEMRYDDPVLVTERVGKIMDIMTRDMMRITPDVVSRAEPALMRRWNKAAEPVWGEVDGKKVLEIWEPKKEEE